MSQSKLGVEMRIFNRINQSEGVEGKKKKRRKKDKKGKVPAKINNK